MSTSIIGIKCNVLISYDCLYTVLTKYKHIPNTDIRSVIPKHKKIKMLRSFPPYAVAYECALSCVSSVSRRWLVLTNYAYYCIVVNRG